MDKIESILKNVEPIIMNCKKKISLPSWENDDYLQEGRILALEMLQQAESWEERKFYGFFKVRFSHFLIDNLRRIKANKRKCDTVDYIEISEVAYLIGNLNIIEDELTYKWLWEEIIILLSKEELNTFTKLANGHAVERNKKFRLKKKIKKYLNNDSN